MEEYFPTFEAAAVPLAPSMVTSFASVVASSTFEVVMHSKRVVVGKGGIGKQAAPLVVHIRFVAIGSMVELMQSLAEVPQHRL